MTALNIYKVDDNSDNLVTTLPTGEHIIGRGPLLQCEDKRVSRQHALIKVNENGASIKSVHVNPCFYLSGAGKNVTILPKDEDVPLNDCDKFSLCVDSFWYRVKLVKNEDQNGLNGNAEDLEIKPEIDEISGENGEGSENEEQTTREEEEINQDMELNTDYLNEQRNSSNKRKNDSIEENDAKKTKIEPTEDEIKIEPNATNSEDLGEGSSNGEQAKVKEENVKLENNDDDNVENNETEKKEVQSRRERCWYGASCYRKCGNHRENFSHPGDEDYDSDPNDNRPSCSYGASCYRRNIEHRREYKHPTGKPAKKTNSKQKQTKRRVTQNKTVDSYQDDSDEDEYDLEDPFLDDNSSDNYEVSSSGSDSDWDSTNDEDGEEEEKKVRKRLIKEAKKFTKK